MRATFVSASDAVWQFQVASPCPLQGGCWPAQETPVVRTQLEDLEFHHTSPRLAEDIKRSPLLTGMCLVSVWKPEGINSTFWISIPHQGIREG